MDIQLIFRLLNFGILLPWILLIFLPKWKGTQWMVKRRLPAFILAVVYLVLLLEHLWTAPLGSGVDFMSLESIKNAFMQDKVMLIGWIHYLAFDLFVGMWELKNAQENQLPHYWLAPCLFFTMMYGPVGLVLYWVFRQCFASK